MILILRFTFTKITFDASNCKASKIVSKELEHYLGSAKVTGPLVEHCKSDWLIPRLL